MHRYRSECRNYFDDNPHARLQGRAGRRRGWTRHAPDRVSHPVPRRHRLRLARVVVGYFSDVAVGQRHGCSHRCACSDRRSQLRRSERRARGCSFLLLVQCKSKKAHQFWRSCRLTSTINARCGFVPYIFFPDTTGCAGHHDQIYYLP